MNRVQSKQRFLESFRAERHLRVKPSETKIVRVTRDLKNIRLGLELEIIRLKKCQGS